MRKQTGTLLSMLLILMISIMMFGCAENEKNVVNEDEIEKINEEEIFGNGESKKIESEEAEYKKDNKENEKNNVYQIIVGNDFSEERAWVAFKDDKDKKYIGIINKDFKILYKEQFIPEEFMPGEEPEEGDCEVVNRQDFENGYAVDTARDNKGDSRNKIFDLNGNITADIGKLGYSHIYNIYGGYAYCGGIYCVANWPDEGYQKVEPTIGFIDGKGNPVTSMVSYEECPFLNTEKDWIIGGKGIFSDGKKVFVPTTDISFEVEGTVIKITDNNLIISDQKEKYLVYDETGNIIAEISKGIKINEEDFGEELATFLNQELVLEKAKESLGEVDIQFVGDFHEGYYAIMIEGYDGKYITAIDKNGLVAFEPIITEEIYPKSTAYISRAGAPEVSNGLLRVVKNEETIFVDMKGNTKISFSSKYMTNFYDGYAYSVDRGCYVDMEGNPQYIVFD